MAHRMTDEDIIKRLNEPDFGTEEDLPGHFESYAFRDWADAGREGGRIIRLMCSLDADEGLDSADELGMAVGLACWNVMCRRMGAALGVSWRDLDNALDRWAEDYDFGDASDLPPSIGFGGLKRLVEKIRAHREAGLIEVLCATSDLAQ